MGKKTANRIPERSSWRKSLIYDGDNSIRVFHSWDDFLRVAEWEPEPYKKVPVTSGQDSSAASRIEADNFGFGSMSEPWFGSKTFDEALTYAQRGWPEGLGSMRPIYERIVDSISSEVSKPVDIMDVSGEDLDVGAYLSGEPECFISDYESESTRAHEPIEITVSFGYGCSVEGQAIVHRGSAICALVALLETAGYSCGITVTTCIRDLNGNPGDYYLSIRVCNAGDPLDLDRLSFALISPALQRRLVWSVRENEALWNRTKYGAYGASSYSRAINKPPLVKTDFHIPQGDLDESFSEIEKSEAWVRERLRELGVLIPTEGGAI